MFLNIAKANTRIAELEAMVKDHAEQVSQFEAMTKQIDTLKAEVEDYKKTIAAYPLAKQEQEDQVKTLTEGHAKAIEELNKTNSDAVAKLTADFQLQIKGLNEQLEATKNSVTEQVTAKLAELGVPQVKEETISQKELTKEQAVQQLSKLYTEGKAKEASAFYDKYRSLILG